MRKVFTLLVLALFSVAMFGQLTLEPGIPGTLTDLTPEGTYLTSIAHDNKNLDMSKLSLIPESGLVIFSATDGGVATGDEIYVTDGTVEGTMLLMDINPGVGSSSPTSFCVSGGKCYFTADDGTSGFELWVTDGTAENTMMVTDINVAGSSTPQKITDFHGKVLFKAADAFDAVAETSSLWVSDGTEAGTGKVHDVEPMQALGPWSYYPMFLVLEDRAIFAGDDGMYGREIWVTDGEIESQNTMMVLDIMFMWSDSADHSAGTIGNPDIDWGQVINPKQAVIRPRPSAFFYPEHVEAGTRDYVTVHNEPWVTDGTPQGTYPLVDMNKDLNNNQDGTNNSGYGESAIFKGDFFFRGNFNPWGNQWHVTDGTPEGTTCFVDIRGWKADGTHEGSGNALDYHTIWGDYFVTEGTVSGYDTVANHFRTINGFELMITDGDSANTELFADIAPGELNGVPGQKATIIVVNGKLYFNADPSGEENNFELHVATDPVNRVYDETIKKVFDGPGFGDSQSSTPQLFTNLKGSLLMVTDAESEGAKLVLYDDGESEKMDDAIDWSEHFVPVTDYKNPYIADYEALDPDIAIENYNTGFWAGVGIEEYEIPTNEGGPMPNIFPNPASDFIQLKLETAAMASIVVYDVQGKAVWHKSDVPNNTQISVDEITSTTGLYYIWVNSSEGLVINPVILNGN